MSMDVILILASLFSIAAAVLAFIFIIPDKKRARLNKFGQFLHDLCNFKFLIIEKILQFCYVLATAYTLISGFFMLFWFERSYFSYSSEWYGYYGLFMMILGPIFVRIVYESLMLALIAVKNIIQINNKLKNQNNDNANVDPFATPEIKDYSTTATSAPANNGTICPYCGAPKNPGEFCIRCGKK